MKIKGYNTIREALRRTRGCIGNDIDYDTAKLLLKNDENIILLDVRSPQEYREGHLEGSINIPLYDISKDINNVVQNTQTPIIVYCQSGSRSKKAMEILNKKQYKNLYNIDGGLDNI